MKTDRQTSQFEFIKTGDAVYVRRKFDGEFGVGVVLRKCNNGDIFVRLIYDTISKSRKSGWGRYGVDKNSGLFIRNCSSNSWTIDKMDGVCTSSTFTVSNNKTVTDDSYTYMTHRNIQESITVIKYNDRSSQMTFVILNDKNYGGCAEGICSDSTKLATYEAYSLWVNEEKSRLKKVLSKEVDSYEY